jgi:SAM-dependent methyltransferase
VSPARGAGPPVADDAGSTWVADAGDFDRWFDQPWGRYASGIERAAVLDAAGDLSGTTVADIGCGTGRLTAELERRAPWVVGLDPDPSMLAVAARRTAVPLVVGDGHRLPFGTHAVAVAIAVTVCEFTVDPGGVIAELARITRPGGRVIVGALNRNSPWGLANRRQLDQPPWDRARFLTADDLCTLGRPHGTIEVRGALVTPTALPLIDVWGPVVERAGRRLARRWCAFNVLVIHRDGPEVTP